MLVIDLLVFWPLELSRELVSKKYLRPIKFGCDWEFPSWSNNPEKKYVRMLVELSETDDPTRNRWRVFLEVTKRLYNSYNQKLKNKDATCRPCSEDLNLIILCGLRLKSWIIMRVTGSRITVWSTLKMWAAPSVCSTPICMYVYFLRSQSRYAYSCTHSQTFPIVTAHSIIVSSRRSIHVAQWVSQIHYHHRSFGNDLWKTLSLYCDQLLNRIILVWS